LSPSSCRRRTGFFQFHRWLEKFLRLRSRNWGKHAPGPFSEPFVCCENERIFILAGSVNGELALTVSKDARVGHARGRLVQDRGQREIQSGTQYHRPTCGRPRIAGAFRCLKKVSGGDTEPSVFNSFAADRTADRSRKRPGRETYILRLAVIPQSVSGRVPGLSPNVVAKSRRSNTRTNASPQVQRRAMIGRRSGEQVPIYTAGPPC
jgi:hypothetical protein